jgi:DnaJ-class molecular chaperone
MASKSQNYYEALGVDEKASLVDIQNAYNTLVDKLGTAADSASIAAMEAYGAAYEVLSDQGQRDEYDNSLKKQANGAAAKGQAKGANAKDTAEKRASNAKDSASQRATDAKKAAAAKAEDLKQQAKPAAYKATAAKDSAAGTASEAKDKTANKGNEVKQQAKEAAKPAIDNAQQTKDKVQQKAQQTKSQAQDKAKPAIDKAQEVKGNVQGKAQDAATEAQRRAQPVIDQAKEQVSALQDKAKEAQKEAQRQAQPVLDKAKEQYDRAKDQAVKVKDEAVEKAQPVVEDAKKQLNNAAAEAQKQAKPVVDQAKAAIQQAQDQLKPAVQDAAQKAQETINSATGGNAGAGNAIKGSLDKGQTVTSDKLTAVSRMLTNTLGSGRMFEEYVGQFAMAASYGISQMQEEKTAVAALQEGRRAVLAKLLKVKLHPYVNGDVDLVSFKATFTKEAEELASLPFGTGMLRVIGASYERAAKPYLSNVVAAWISRTAHNVATTASAGMGYASVKMMQYDVSHYGEKGKAMDIAEMVKYFEDRMGWTISNIWNLLVYDVEDTCYAVAKSVLDEEDIDDEVRKMRAAAIMEIGKIFQSAERKGDRAICLCPQAVPTELLLMSARALRVWLTMRSRVSIRLQRKHSRA